MTRKITIHPVLNGFVVGVGCQTVCFNTMEELCSQLMAYSKSVPDGYEKGFISGAVNKDLAEGPQAAPPPGIANPPILHRRETGLRWEGNTCGTARQEADPLNSVEAVPTPDRAP